MKLEISNRLSIWPRRLVCWDLVHYECSEIMSQDGGCHLGVESGHLIVIMDTMVTVGCWPGHKCPAFYCRVIWYPAEVLMLAAQLTADMIRGKVLKCYPCRRACDDECIIVLCTCCFSNCSDRCTCSEAYCSSRAATLNNCPHTAAYCRDVQ